jgi:hypothetical protein
MDAIKTTLFTFASDIRYFIRAGFQNLPLSIAGIMLIIGFFTANYGMIFFLLGYIVILPFLLFLLNKIPFLQGLVNDAPACALITPYEFPTEKLTEPVNGIGYWIPMTSFFIGYILTNAAYLYTTPTKNPYGSQPPNEEPLPDATSTVNFQAGLSNRITKTATAMIITGLIFIACIAYRIITGCEGWGAVVIGGLLGLIGGGTWYSFLQGIAEQRISDLFGMANRLLVPQALLDAPYACLPTKS